MNTNELIDICLSDNYIPYLDLFNDIEQITSGFEKNKLEMLLNAVNSKIRTLPIDYRYQFTEKKEKKKKGINYSRTERTYLGKLLDENVSNEEVAKNKNIYQIITCIKIMGVEVYKTPQIVNFENLQHIIFTKESIPPTDTEKQILEDENKTNLDFESYLQCKSDTKTKVVEFIISTLNLSTQKNVTIVTLTIALQKKKYLLNINNQSDYHKALTAKFGKVGMRNRFSELMGEYAKGLKPKYDITIESYIIP